MSTIDIAKLQANLMTDAQSGDKQVLESTIMQALPVMFGEMPSVQFTNQTGSQDKAGNVTYYKTKIQENNDKDFSQIGDLSRFKDLSTEKILVALDNVIENPVKYYSSEVEMSADGILAQTETGMTMNMVEKREISILTEMWASAQADAAVQIKDIALDTITTDELERIIDDSISQLRKTKDTGVNKVPLSRIVVMVDPVVYQRLLKVRLIIPGNTINEEAFKNGAFPAGKYKGVMIIENVYMEDANEQFVGAVFMTGAIASPWRPEGVANQLAPGEAAVYLLNPQIRFKTKAIYPKHIIALNNTDAAPVVPAPKPVTNTTNI